MPVELKGAKFVCLRAEAVEDISEIGDNYSHLKHTIRIRDLDSSSLAVALVECAANMVPKEKLLKSAGFSNR